MKAGVGTSPCLVRKTTARAAPSVAITVKCVIGLVTLCHEASKDEHGVAEGIEAVALRDRELVQVPGLLDADEGHHEREQRRARQMEVREERVDAPELEARRDEQRSPAGE